jgi:phosphoribosylaminoimidazole-succinocarboxamide synthase
MKSPETLYQSNLKSLALLGRGKVRDIYSLGTEHLLIVASDRISAFDCILPDPIPGKGRVLTSVSNFWFEKLKGIVPNHLAGLTLEQALPDRAEREQVEGRAVLVKRLAPLPIEAVVRGYLIGSGWKDYLAQGSVCGVVLPPGLELAAKLPEPIFTPATKAEFGQHDENISFERAAKLIGPDLAEQVREKSLALYSAAAAYALTRGIIIADTKFEFGLDIEGRLYLIDEALTPDSSRFWPVEDYRPGGSPPSFDKQFLRDYLESLNWDKRPPAPRLPAEIIAKTAAKYREAESLLTASRSK